MYISDKVMFKARIASMICANEDLMSLLEIEEGETVYYKRVLPYLYVPILPQEAHSYIAFEVDTPSIRNNEAFKDWRTTFKLICHKDFLQTEYGGNRLDMIEGVLTRMFTWSIKLGFEMKLRSANSFVLSEAYYYTDLLFDTLTYNNLDCGLKHGLLDFGDLNCVVNGV